MGLRDRRAAGSAGVAGGAWPLNDLDCYVGVSAGSFLAASRGRWPQAPLVEGGLPVVLSQTFRAVIHSRMAAGISKYRTQYRGSDVVLFQPEADDGEIFFTSVFSYAARHGVRYRRRRAAGRTRRPASLDRTGGRDSLRAIMAAKADGNTLRTERTRARVLAESLRQFNELGESHVTTGMIAAALDMSPGNLYYHFRNKDQIIEELFARFEERIDVQPGAPVGGPAPRYDPRGPEAIEDLWLYLHLMLEGIRDYRFLYRNLDDLAARNRRLRERFNRIFDRKAEVVVALCEGLVRLRVMRATPAEIRALARNVLLVATYWLNFHTLRTRRGAVSAADDNGDASGQGAFQVMALVAPYLLGEARGHLDRLSRHYID